MSDDENKNDVQKKADGIIRKTVDGYFGKTAEEPEPSYGYGSGNYSGGYGYGRWGRNTGGGGYSSDDYYNPNGRNRGRRGWWDDDDAWESARPASVVRQPVDWDKGDDMPEFLRRGRTGAAGSVPVVKRDDLINWKAISEAVAEEGKLVVSTHRFELVVDQLVREMNNALEAAGLVWKGEAQSQNLRRQVEAMVSEDVNFHGSTGEVFEVVTKKKEGE